jgi:hypothetical protein
VTTHCGPRLRYLSLDMNCCAPSGLMAIAEHCRILEEPQLSNCKFEAADEVGGPLSSLPRLIELLLVDSCVATNKVLSAIAAHLKNLRSLVLSAVAVTA